VAVIRKNLIYNLLLSITQILVPLVTIPLVSRQLNPTGLGKAGFFDNYSFFFAVLAEMGIMVYAQRRIALLKDRPHEMGKFVSEILCIHILSTLLISALYLTLSLGITDEIFEWPLFWAALMFFLLNAFTCEWYFIGTEQFRFIAIRVIFVRLAALAAIFLFVRSKEDYIVYYFIIAGSGIINILLNFGLLMTQVKLTLKKINLKQHLPFLWIMYGISVLQGVALYMDSVILGMVSTAAAVGLYTLAMRVVKLATALITDSLLVFFPKIVQAQENSGEVRSLLLKNFQWISFVGIPAMLGVIVFAADIVNVLLGSKYLDVVLPLRGLALFGLFRIYSSYYSKQYLVAFGKEKYYFNSLLIGSLSLVVTAAVGGYFFGEKGAVIAIVLSEGITMLMVVLFCKKFFEQLVFDKLILNNTLIASLSFILVHSVLHSMKIPGFFILFGGIVVSGTLYLLIMYYFLKDEFTHFVWKQARQLLPFKK
jgi:O-antigen/teichoic acid export membrane protein